MYSLFKVNFNWGAYILVLIAITMLWPGLSWYSLIAFAICLFQFNLLFNAFGSVIPIRYLAGTLMCIQMLLGPAFAYNGLDEYQYMTYQMKVPEDTYFQYVIPAVILFILGLNVTAGKLKGEVLDQKAVMHYVDNSGNLPYIFIGVGFVASVVAGFFGSGLTFVFVLLSNAKFIGLFMLLMGSKKLKLLPIVVVMGSIIMDALSIAMFHDLLVWFIMLGAIISIKYQFKFVVKATATAAFILIAVVIQQLKKDYRQSSGIEGTGLETFEKVYKDQSQDNSLFSYEKLAESNVRINQGYIITNIMSTVPQRVPFENGKEMIRILEAAFLPRIIAPNKLNAGDREIFMKYTGLQLRKGTSMGLSSVGDAYINFGVVGGSIFMFFLGLAFSEVLNAFQKYSKEFPFLLLFTPLVFYYPIRPDCELQTTLGHLVKSCMLIYFVILFWRKDLTQMTSKKQKPQPGLNSEIMSSHRLV
jgi:hypothetical protein